jgi:molybdopterin converting factor small subunit
MNDFTTATAHPARTRVRLRLFGAFRDAAGGDELRLEVPSGTTVAHLRAHVKEALARTRPARRHDHLVEVSALASDSAILPESHLVGDGGDVCLSILPPVCGG